MGFSEKLRNKMGARCAKSGWLSDFGNCGWRSGETLGLIIFAFIIFFVVVLDINLGRGICYKYELYEWETL